MKKLAALSMMAALATAGFADAEVDALKAQMEELKAKLSALEAKQTGTEALSKDLATVKKTLSEVRAHDANDNIKWGVDFRSSFDMLNYKDMNGKTYSDSILSNRLWLDMKFAPTEKLSFIGQLSYNKAFGANPPRDAATGYPQRGAGFDTFDWVINENLTDSTIKVKQAYWIYFGDMGSVPYTVSVGRRPSLNGAPANLREDDPAQSPLGHTINVEFDGASILWDLDKVTGVPGASFKLCLGRGLTNAKSRFQSSGGDYFSSGDTLSTVDMAGFIVTPYNDGQYSVVAQIARGMDVPGYNGVTATATGMIYDADNNMSNGFNLNPNAKMYNLGDMDLFTVTAMAKGIGEEGFLGNTTVFASYGMTKTHPNKNYSVITGFNNLGQPIMGQSNMLGSTESKTGHSIWIGAQMPAVFTDDGKIGLEYNHGSKYWRPFTYAEDSLIGSKLATRGNAYEAYYTQPLMKGLSMQLRYTYIDYKYTGSQMFFGEDGAPMTMSEFKNKMALYGITGANAVDSASDLRFYLRYRY